MQWPQLQPSSQRQFVAPLEKAGSCDSIRIQKSFPSGQLICMACEYLIYLRALNSLQGVCQEVKELLEYRQPHPCWGESQTFNFIMSRSRTPKVSHVSQRNEDLSISSATPASPLLLEAICRYRSTLMMHQKYRSALLPLLLTRSNNLYY